jgi:hypothetical protein
MMWTIAALNGCRDNEPHPGEVEFGELAGLLSEPLPHRGAKETIPAWMPTILRPDDAGRYRRAKASVVAVSCLVLDLDQGEPLERAAALAEGYTAMMHTSWSHTPEHPKARLVFPFAEPAPAARWDQVWDAAARWALKGGLTLDPATKDASRLYFLPAYPAGDETRRRAFRAWVRYDDDDQLLSWRRLLLDHPAPVEARRHPPVPSSAYRVMPGQDATAGRRRFAAAIIDTRARELASMGEGGRNLAAFRAGAVAAQLAEAGALELASARSALVAAAMSSGLSAREADDAVDNGIKRGRSDGAFQFRD